jgi:hypothetical protein
MDEIRQHSDCLSRIPEKRRERVVIIEISEPLIDPVIRNRSLSLLEDVQFEGRVITRARSACMHRPD